MKPFLIATLVALVLASCSSSDENQDLAKLKQQKDSLKTVKTELATQLADLEAKIAELDTNMEKNLAVVTTTNLDRTLFEHYVTIQGVVETEKNAQLFPEAQGRIKQILVKEGDKVSAGQKLMILDDKVVRNSIQELENQLALAETVFQKQKNLWDQKIGSEIQFLEAKTQRDGLQRSLETARAQLDMYHVKAPFSGIVDEVIPKVGEMASPAMPAFRLINLDKVYIKGDVSESYLGKIKEGDSVAVKLPSLDRKVWATIDRIGNYINPNNRSFKITVNIDNESGMMKPNLLAEIDIRDFVADSAIVLPSSIIQEDSEGNSFVMQVDNSGTPGPVARKTVVETGKTFKGQTLIMGGLKGSEKLIDKGGRTVKDGEEIKIQG